LAYSAGEVAAVLSNTNHLRCQLVAAGLLFGINASSPFRKLASEALLNAFTADGPCRGGWSGYGPVPKMEQSPLHG